ncbi:MAG: XdhC family protein [Pseudomonadota bacterium]
MDLHKVLLFLSERRLKREPAVLVTVCAVEGSSMRNPGTIMGVAEDGSFEGSLSGGCIENAVVAEALDTLKDGMPRIVRFGAGSPYLDIKLPCGGGLDLHFCPISSDDEIAAACLETIHSRRPFSIAVEPGGVLHKAGWETSRFEAASGTGVFGHWPAPQLQIIGHGAGVEALARLGTLLGCSTRVLTSDERIHDALRTHEIDVDILKRRTQTDVLVSDPWTAFVFLFHDHDWEIELMARALELPHFYLGAMGGRKAHTMRCEALAARGVSQEKLKTIRAPIGVFHSSRDPDTLALSTLAQVVKAYQDADFQTLCAELALG